VYKALSFLEFLIPPPPHLSDMSVLRIQLTSFDALTPSPAKRKVPFRSLLPTPTTFPLPLRETWPFPCDRFISPPLGQHFLTSVSHIEPPLSVYSFEACEMEYSRSMFLRDDIAPSTPYPLIQHSPPRRLDIKAYPFLDAGSAKCRPFLHVCETIILGGHFRFRDSSTCDGHKQDHFFS